MDTEYVPNTLKEGEKREKKDIVRCFPHLWSFVCVLFQSCPVFIQCKGVNLLPYPNFHQTSSLFHLSSSSCVWLSLSQVLLSFPRPLLLIIKDLSLHLFSIVTVKVKLKERILFIKGIKLSLHAGKMPQAGGACFFDLSALRKHLGCN